MLCFCNNTSPSLSLMSLVKHESRKAKAWVVMAMAASSKLEMNTRFKN